MLKRIIIGLLIVFIIAQFFQPSKNKGNAQTATDITHVVPVPDTVMALLKVACYDCHSDSTRYPWYNNISPVSWWLRSHINDGKRGLNFSEYTKGTYKRKMKRLEEAADQVEKHEMPISSYLWIHKDARLSDAQRKLIIDWANGARELVLKDSIAHSSIQ
ncbi:MAG: heme-binding domain-containing protein [Flavisolibacter sp.]